MPSRKRPAGSGVERMWAIRVVRLTNARPGVAAWLAAAAAAALAGIALCAPAATAQGRNYELVTPADDLLYDADVPWARQDGQPFAGNGQRVTPDGRHLVWATGPGGNLPGMAQDGEIRDFFVASRGTTGWSSRSPLADRSGVGCGIEGGQPDFHLIDDSGATMVTSFRCPRDKIAFSGVDPLTGGPFDQTYQSENQRDTYYRIDVESEVPEFLGTKFDASGPVPRLPATTGSDSDLIIDASSDATTVYFASNAGLLPDVPDVAGLQMIYRRTHGTTTLVTRTATGEPFFLFGTNPNPLDRPNAVSVDGSQITLTAGGGQPMVLGDENAVADVYQVEGDEVRWASDPAAVPLVDRPAVAQTAANRLFHGASGDGQRVFFSTTEQMTADDGDTALDIYVYDRRPPAGGAIRRVSRVDAGACAGCDDASSSTSGLTHGNANFVTVSEDGSRVFMITGAVLDEADADGQPSLYVHDLDGGRTHYVAPAGAGVTTATNGTDAGTNTANSLVRLQAVGLWSFKTRPIKVSPDGRTAVVSLATNVPLAPGRGGDDADAARDLFLWREGDGLRRVPQGTGADDSTVTVPTFGCYGWGARPPCRALTADGSLAFFETTDSLVAEDSDAGFVDVYTIDVESGSVALVTPPGSAGGNARYVDSTPSGSDVFFTTTEPVDPARDLDFGRSDVYVARLGDVFGPPPLPTEPCRDDGCQPPPVAPREPAMPATPGAGDDIRPGPRLRMTVVPLTRRQRTILARGRPTRLRVRVSGPGRIDVTGRARIDGRTRTVLGASRLVAGPAALQLPIALSASARRALGSGGSLTVRLAIRFTGRPGVRRTNVILRAPAKRSSKSRIGGAR